MVQGNEKGSPSNEKCVLVTSVPTNQIANLLDFITLFLHIITRWLSGFAGVPKYAPRKEGRKEGTCLFDINIKHNTEIYIGKIISGDSH